MKEVSSCCRNVSVLPVSISCLEAFTSCLELLFPACLRQVLVLMSLCVSQKGQNLEPFIQSFFNSCESPKPKPSRPELTVLSPSAENNKKVKTTHFLSEQVAMVTMSTH